MRSILFLLPNLHYRSHARQSSLLSETLPGEQFSPSIYSLQGAGPFAESLRRSGAVVQCASGHRALGLDDLLALRRVLQVNSPELVHVWGLEALRVLGYATVFKRSILPPLVVSLRSSHLRKNRLAWLDGKLLRRVQAFVTMSEADRSSLVAAGLPAGKIHVIRPGAAAPDMSGSATDFRQNLDIPMDAPIIMGVGHLETADRFHDLVWAYEFMKYILPQLQLVLIGDGPNRDRLGHHFHTARDPKLGVHFLGFRSDAASLLTLADVVVVPHRRVGGTFAVLEAMGAGRPVVATRLPHLAEIIRDGETGLLVPPVDQPALARCILRLLENRPLQDEIGTNSRSWMLGECRVATMTQGFVQVYTDVLKR